MSFVYNNEVIDLLLKKSLGSAYTSSALVPGQENQILPKILNQQLLASPITNKTTSAFTWSASSNVAGGGTVKSLSNVAGETEPTSFTYIKKYENIPMTAVAGTNYRAWKPSNADMISKLENTIIGKSSFPFTLTTNINNYNTIYNTNSSFKPVISNGVLLFLGNIAPASSSTISFTEVHIYEGEFGAKSELELNELTNVNVPTPSNGELLQWDAANSKWIAGAAASSAIANANIEALNNVNVSHATTNQDDSLIYDKANSQWVAGTPVTTLTGLSDTTISSPSDKQSLVYNATNTKWENDNLTTDNITDINLTSVSNGQALVYDSGTSKFINGLPTMSINNMSDVNISTPAAKNALIYDTATQKWINGLPLLNVNDINDVNTSGLIDGQVLVYNNNTQKWVPGSAAASSVTGVYLRDLQDVDMTNLAQVVPVWTQSHKLAATTGQNGEYLGKSVSTIGTWTAVGAANNQDTGNLLSNVGRVFLFKAGTETQIISSPQNREGSFFGQSVFLTSTFLAVGSTGYDDLTNSVINTGAVLIYNYNSGTELYATTPDQTLLGTANSYLGYSIDTNGTWMISGAPENISGTNNALKGKAYIYKLDGTWSQKKILTADDGANGDKFGTAVAINDDYAFVGCETKTSYTGGVYIYKRTSDTVWDALHIVRTKTLATGDYFGQSISVAGDFLMVGCPKGEYAGTANSTKAGEVFVYKKLSNGNWGDLSGNLSTPTWIQDTSVGATKSWHGITSSADWTKLAAVVYGGTIWTSSNSGATWTEDTSVGATKNWHAITSSTDGTKLAAVVYGGNIWTSSNSGATWTEDTSVNATKNWLAITSTADGTKLTAVVYNGNIWTSTNNGVSWTVDTSIGATKKWYGITSSADGTKLAAVVYGGNIWTSSNSGATWTEITVGDGTNDWYRITSSADGTKLAAVVYDGNIWTSSNSCATWTEITIGNGGESWSTITSSADGTKLAAVVYDGNIWTFKELDPTAGYYENSKLTASDTVVNDHFGCSVDITTQFGIIGARTQSSYLTRGGAAYMISNTNEGYWDHSKKITSSDLAIGDEFGISVSIFDRYASIGAWKEEDTGEVDQGSAYLFNLASSQDAQNTLIYNSDTGRWSIGSITAGGGATALEDLIGTQAMINANTPTGAQLFWDATNQTWTTNTITTLPTGAPNQSTPSAQPTWNTSWNGGDNQLTFNSHLVPTTDDSFDIGSPGNKIRDLYVSENSLWIGDAHKITIESGTMKFRKRDVSIVPASITAAGGHETGALASAGVANLSAMKLHHWETYAKTLNMAGGVGNARISDVFANNDTDYADSDNISDKANTANPTFTGTVTLGQAPTGDLHAATKKYVDDTTNGLNTSTLAPKASPTFTGVVSLPTITNSSAATSAATKQYVDDTAGNIDTSTLAPKASPTFTGVVTLPTITNSSAATSAATKQYVDDTVGNIDTSTLAPKASPTFTGTPVAPTAAVGTNDSQLATTQFVTTATSNLAPKASPVFTGASARIESTTNNSQLQLKATHSSETQQYNIFSAVSGNNNGRGLHFQNHDTGSVQMSIRSDGKVGIGTNSPAGKLSIAHSGGSAATPDSNKDFCIYDHNNCGLYSKSGTSTNGTTISYGLSYWNGSSAVDVDNALVLRNYSDENRVGIGTTSPDEKLHIKGGNLKIERPNTEEPRIELIRNNSSNTFGGDIYQDWAIQNSGGIFQLISGHLSNGNTTVLTSDGTNVGIGTNSPSQKLEVNGTVKATAFQGDGSALTGIITQTDIDTAINGLIDSAPGTLDTLNEIAASIGDNGNFAGSVSNFADVDTVTTAPTDGQALVWDNANSKWKPGSVAASGGGGSTNVRGQSFFEILTQQPHKFQADGAYTSSTSELTINWKYDSILLFHDSTVVAKLCFGANAQAKSLPFISQIKIQLRSTDTGDTWMDYQTLTVTSNQDYNTTASLKTLTLPKFTGTPSGGIQTTLSKAGESNKFDIRVYGINNAENYPNEATRALEYLQVFYLIPNPPSVPIWSSEVAIGSDAQISFYYKCVETENIDPNNAGDQSDAFITSAITKYVEIQTLAYNNAVVGTEYTDTESVSNKNENETFLITLTGLRAGTLYKYKVQAKNNLADNYSGFSAFRNHTNYTRTPGDNSIGTSVSFGINNTSKTSIIGYIDGSSSVSGSQIYINTAASQKVTPATSSTQTIQITDPYSSTQHTTNTGYGNYVNGSTGLVTLKATVDGTLKQTVSYGGFNTTPSQSGGNNNGYIDTIAQSDIYGTTNATKGFRLKGTFALNELSNANITTTIGAARKTAHTLKYEYDRHADVGGSDTSTTHNIYIDTLSGNAGITYTTSLATVTSVKYTMGIASVDDMTIQIVRTYTNCNSAHGFIRGDGKVGYIGAVSKTTYGAQNWIIAANNIDVGTPGSYTHTKTTTGVNYTQAFTGGFNESLSETSYAYNLNGNTTGTAQSLKRGSAATNSVLNHFHDHNSYANNTTATSKLTLSNLYEITSGTISKFNTDMGAIATQAYTSHSTVPQAWTLLYINGGFRTNANFTYPNTSNVNYDSVSVNTYGNGTTTINTSGGMTTSGYKWYCQKFSMSADKSSHNVGGAITEYLNVVGIGGLSATTTNKVKDADDYDAIGFVQQTVNSSYRIGNLGRPFKSTAVWYEQSGAVSWATQDTSAEKANYGAVYEESSTKWGPILDTINGSNDIYIFIGLKNTVSLS